MKKAQHNILLTITAVFAAFLFGFFLGRNFNHTEVLLTTVVSAQNTETAVISETPAPEEIPEQTQVTKTTEPVNINTATLDELDALPGIGPVLAQRIIDYRDANGPFTSVAQLTAVSGIGNAKLADLLDLITVQ